MIDQMWQVEIACEEATFFGYAPSTGEALQKAAELVAMRLAPWRDQPFSVHITPPSLAD